MIANESGDHDCHDEVVGRDPHLFYDRVFYHCFYFCFFCCCDLYHIDPIVGSGCDCDRHDDDHDQCDHHNDWNDAEDPHGDVQESVTDSMIVIVMAIEKMQIVSWCHLDGVETEKGTTKAMVTVVASLSRRRHCDRDCGYVDCHSQVAAAGWIGEMMTDEQVQELNLLLTWRRIATGQTEKPRYRCDVINMGLWPWELQYIAYTILATT